MKAKPTGQQFHEAWTFLLACEGAAVPPPPATNALVRAARLLDTLYAPSTESSGPPIFIPRSYPITHADVLGKKNPPFASTERLGADRSERIALLNLWLSRYPAIAWMNQQPAVRAGLATFARIQARRKTQPKFSDDLAKIRFWALATWAAWSVDSRETPPPDAQQRQRAMAAARKLRAIAESTLLLHQAGISYQDGQVFLAALNQLQGLATMERRARTDAFSSDRKYVERLAWFAIEQFNDAPPALIVELAALKVKNPDKVSITKQVSELKKAAATHDRESVRTG